MFAESSSASFFFQAEDGIRGLVRSRGLGDVYKRQALDFEHAFADLEHRHVERAAAEVEHQHLLILRTLVEAVGQSGSGGLVDDCLLYTSDAADDLLCVDLGGRRIIKKKKKTRRDRKTHIYK